MALVIGNSTYREAPLPNALNDGRDMADALRALGFAVIPGENLERRAMEDAIITFGEHLQEDDVGLFYFAGHGVQVSGVNYLIPIQAQITKEQHISSEAVPLTRVLQAMERAGNKTNLVILDACRNNPFVGSIRSVTRGLAPVLAPRGMLIAYATDPGDVAADGDGRNGLYTEALLQHMRIPDVEIIDVFKGVGRAVLSKSAGKQVPWVNTSLYEDFYFTLSPHARHGHLQVSVDVEAAQVRINGIEAGLARREAPLRLRPEAGTLTVRVEAAGYDPIERSVTVVENQWTREAFVFRQRVAPLETLAPPPAPAAGPPLVSPPMSHSLPASPSPSEVEIVFWEIDPTTGQPVPRSQPREKSSGGSSKPQRK